MQRPKPPEPPAELQEKAIATMDAAALLGLLKNAATPEFQKAKACVRLGELGAREAVPALAGLLTDEHLSVYARYGLEPIGDASASEALRAALPKLKGNQLIGAINSLGKRRDEMALPALAKMMQGTNVEVARAAASAIGAIGGLNAAKELQTALPKTTGMLKMAVADACLVCAERLLVEGKREQAMVMYTTLSSPSTPKPARLAAMSGIIREETSINRPR